MRARFVEAVERVAIQVVLGLLVAVLIPAGMLATRGPSSAPVLPAASTTQSSTTQTSTTCRAASMTMTLGPPRDEAGTVYRRLRLINTGNQPCVLQGFPDVSFVVDDLYTPIGLPGEREGQPGGDVVLAPRAAAAAVIGIVKVERFAPSECRHIAVKGLRIYLPFDMSPAFVSAPTSACTGKTADAQIKVRRIEADSTRE